MAVDFGSDISCTDDIDPRFSTVTGRRLVAEAIVRRLITPRGRLIDDTEYGTDLTDFVNEDVSPFSLGAMKAAIVAECLKDERVESCEATITAPASGNGAYEIAIMLEVGDGPFTLVISVSSVTIELISVT